MSKGILKASPDYKFTHCHILQWSASKPIAAIRNTWLNFNLLYYVKIKLPWIMTFKCILIPFIIQYVSLTGLWFDYVLWMEINLGVFSINIYKIFPFLLCIPMGFLNENFVRSFWGKASGLTKRGGHPVLWLNAALNIAFLCLVG